MPSAIATCCYRGPLAKPPPSSCASSSVPPRHWPLACLRWTPVRCGLLQPLLPLTFRLRATRSTPQMSSRPCRRSAPAPASMPSGTRSCALHLAPNVPPNWPLRAHLSKVPSSATTASIACLPCHPDFAAGGAPAAIPSRSKRDPRTPATGPVLNLSHLRSLGPAGSPAGLLCFNPEDWFPEPESSASNCDAGPDASVGAFLIALVTPRDTSHLPTHPGILSLLVRWLRHRSDRSLINNAD